MHGDRIGKGATDKGATGIDAQIHDGTPGVRNPKIGEYLFRNHSANASGIAQPLLTGRTVDQYRSISPIQIELSFDNDLLMKRACDG